MSQRGPQLPQPNSREKESVFGGAVCAWLMLITDIAVSAGKSFLVLPSRRLHMYTYVHTADLMCAQIHQ